jgi:hypothetical protein
MRMKKGEEMRYQKCEKEDAELLSRLHAIVEPKQKTKRVNVEKEVEKDNKILLQEKGNRKEGKHVVVFKTELKGNEGK